MIVPLGMLVIKEVFTGITAIISIRKTDTVMRQEREQKGRETKQPRFFSSYPTIK